MTEKATPAQVAPADNINREVHDVILEVSTKYDKLFGRSAVVYYAIPLIWYIVLMLGNPDGVAWYSTHGNCYVIPTSNVCQNATVENGFNATLTWKILYTIGVVLTLFMFSSALKLAMSVGELTPFIMGPFDIIATIVWQIVLICFRWTHPGRVVSGQFCTEG